MSFWLLVVVFRNASCLVTSLVWRLLGKLLSGGSGCSLSVGLPVEPALCSFRVLDDGASGWQ
jgi:hypothetical protein